MSSKINVHPLTEKEYAKCFATFTARTTEYSSMITWTEKFLIDKQYQHPKILSIGAGTGHFDEMFIKLLPSPPSLYTAIEPNDTHFQQLKDRLSKYKFETEFVQEYFEHFSTDQQYDIIIMSHCLYPIPNPSQFMIHASTLLSPEGSLIIFIQTENSMCQFFNKYSALLEWSAPPLADHSVCTKSLCESLDAQHINYDLYICPSHINIDSFFHKTNQHDISTNSDYDIELQGNSQSRFAASSECDTKIIHDLLTFYIQTDTTKLPPNIIKDMIHDIKSGVYPGTHNYSHPGGVIVIHK